MASVWAKGQGLSACYLLASTVLLMIVVFLVEDVLFPAKFCMSCNIKSRERLELLVNIDQTRALHQRRAEDDLKTKSNVADEEGTKISDLKRNVEVSEVDLSNAHGTDKDRKSKVEKLPDGNASDVKTIRKPTDDGVGEKNGSSSLAQSLPPQLRTVWYYTFKHEHPVAELRLLTAKDGAPRLRSNRSPPEREITIVTQTSADRLPALETTCTTWGGAIVVAVHVRLQSQFASVYEQVKEMHARMEEQSGCRLNIQLVTEDGYETDEEALRALYPVNALRNVALGMAETKLIFLLDADFKPSPRLHESLTDDEETYEALLRKATEERKLFVVPAFEAARVRGGRAPPTTVPETMEELRKGWDDKTIDCFHCVKSRTGHMPTNFEKFFDPATTSPYQITYKNGFEPYVIGALDVIPPYDGRFRGYGENKVSQLYACAADGMGFIILPNVFVFELPHPPSQAHETYNGKKKDPDQRNRIKGLYAQFQQEIQKKQMEKDPKRYLRFRQLSKEPLGPSSGT